MSFESLRQNFYNRVTSTPFEPKPNPVPHSDIVLHLPVLEYYASLCLVCVEFGTRDGNSAVALLAGCPGEVHSYDLNDTPIRPQLETYPETKDRWFFHRGSTIDPGTSLPEKVDLIFFDTLHTYDHLSAELRMHAHKARKFLIFHDTFTCGERDVSGRNPRARGIMPAIQEYREANPHYEVVYETTRCNGLLVLKNCPN